MKKIIIIILLVPIILIVQLFTLYYINMFFSTEYHYNYVAENNDNSRLYEYDNEDIYLSLIWINEKRVKGPYSLALSVESLNDSIEHIYIKEIKIVSSKGYIYLFDSIEIYPFYLFDRNRELDTHLSLLGSNSNFRSYYFNDTFNFLHKQNEIIKLKMKIEYTGEELDNEVILEIIFIPYKEKFTPPFLLNYIDY